MKKLILCLLIMLVILPVGVSSAQPLKPDADIKVFINGEQIQFDVAPIMVNNTTLVQFTPIFKKLNLSYEWEPNTKVITGSKDDRTLRLQINNEIVSINDNNIKLPASPLLYESRTIVPLRFVSEAAGMDVMWDQQNKIINIVNAVNPKVYTKPDIKKLMHDADFTTKHLQFLALIKVEPDHIEGSTYTFHNQPLFDYKASLSVSFDKDDMLQQYEYMLPTNDLTTSPLFVYSELNKQLEKMMGVPSQYKVMKYDSANDIDVTKTVTDHALIRGLRNGTHYIIATWELSDIAISTLVLKEGEAINIYAQFHKLK